MLHIVDTILKVTIQKAREVKFNLPSAAQLVNGSGRIWTHTLKGVPFLLYLSSYGQARSHLHFTSLVSMVSFSNFLGFEFNAEMSQLVEENSMEEATVERLWLFLSIPHLKEKWATLVTTQAS